MKDFYPLLYNTIFVFLTLFAIYLAIQYYYYLYPYEHFSALFKKGKEANEDDTVKDDEIEIVQKCNRDNLDTFFVYDNKGNRLYQSNVTWNIDKINFNLISKKDKINVAFDFLSNKYRFKCDKYNVELINKDKCQIIINDYDDLFECVKKGDNYLFKKHNFDIAKARCIKSDGGKTYIISMEKDMKKYRDIFMTALIVNLQIDKDMTCNHDIL